MDREEYIELYDLYGSLLTEHQRSIFKDYFFEDLTQEEISNNNGISKNAVSKTLKIIKELLDEYEKKLRMKEYMLLLKKEFASEKDILQRIEKYDNIVL